MSDIKSETNSLDCEEMILEDEQRGSVTSSRRSHKTPYKQVSDELRRMIVNSIENGSCSRKSASETFNVSYATVVSIYKRFLDTGKTCKRRGGTESVKKLTEEHKEFLQKLLVENCKYTMKELKAFLQDKFEIVISSTTISRGIPAFLFTVHRLQRVTLLTATPTQKIERKVYCEHFMCVNNSERMVVYYGEADFHITMRQLARRETPGVGPQVINPTIRHRKKTVMAAMTKFDLLHYKAVKLTANNASVIDFFNSLFPILEDRTIYGAVIIIDDAIFNRSHEIKDLIEQAGHLLLILTENCPFLNPVENVFLKWTKYIRTKNPHSETDMETVINSFKRAVTSENCTKYCQLVVDNAQKCVSDSLVM